VKRSLTCKTFFCYLLCILLTVVALGAPTRASADDTNASQADHDFVQAAARGDGVAVGKLLDSDFSWTDADGKTYSRSNVLSSMPKPALGNESGATLTHQSHSQLDAIISSRDKIYVLRVWVKRAGNWRLINYHEVELGRGGGSADSGSHECDNPCKGVPYKPKNETEQAVIVSWEKLETAVAAHDAETWSPHIASEFTMLGSTNDHPLNKSDRIATLNMQKQTGRGALPAPVVSAQMYEFGDALVMTSVHQPYSGKSMRVSRLWIKRDGKWMMAISFQTTIA